MRQQIWISILYVFKNKQIFVWKKMSVLNVRWKRHNKDMVSSTYQTYVYFCTIQLLPLPNYCLERRPSRPIMLVYIKYVYVRIKMQKQWIFAITLRFHWWAGLFHLTLILIAIKLRCTWSMKQSCATSHNASSACSKTAAQFRRWTLHQVKLR